MPRGATARSLIVRVLPQCARLVAAPKALYCVAYTRPSRITAYTQVAYRRLACIRPPYGVSRRLNRAASSMTTIAANVTTTPIAHASDFVSFRCKSPVGWASTRGASWGSGAIEGGAGGVTATCVPSAPADASAPSNRRGGRTA
jgi:hypothetical protein